ncbi:MAG TPA: molybdenum cofactor guanylyltransferase [Anaerolineales bacterium]|nr:molybdenum cofactor guanylyltransferase [Anaerolineales bacterium]
MLTVCIQAGGASSRMGEDKALKLFLGRPLIQRVVDRLQSIADELIVTTNHPADLSFLNLRLISDVKPGRGALGGLYTAIASAAHPLVAVIACDMPFASAKLIQLSVEIMEKENVDVVIAKNDEGYEPLHAVYRRETCLPAIESAINADQWRVVSWLPQVNLRVLTDEQIQSADPSGLAFWNVNTPEEFAQAEGLAISRSTPGKARG